MQPLTQVHQCSAGCASGCLLTLDTSSHCKQYEVLLPAAPASLLCCFSWGVAELEPVRLHPHGAVPQLHLGQPVGQRREWPHVLSCGRCRAELEQLAPLVQQHEPVAVQRRLVEVPEGQGPASAHGGYMLAMAHCGVMCAAPSEVPMTHGLLYSLTAS